MRACPEEPQSGVGLRIEGSVTWDAWFIGASTDSASGFVVDLVEWTEPRAKGSGRRRANELGIFRMALLTEDIDRDYAALIDSGVTCHSPPVELEMGPGLPSDLRALFFEDPDGVCIELIESPSSPWRQPVTLGLQTREWRRDRRGAIWDLRIVGRSELGTRADSR